MDNNIKLALTCIGQDLRINHIVAIRATKTKVLLKYKAAIVAEFDRVSLVLKDYSYHYYNANNYDADLRYWVEKFREELFAII